MLKKFLTLMMIFSIFSTQAMAANGLKAAFEDLNFALNVEWDQQDGDFYNDKMNEFTVAVQKSGLSQAELIAFIKGEIKDQRIAGDVEAALTSITLSKMSPLEAGRYMASVLDASLSKGASWHGRSATARIVKALVVYAIAVVIVHELNERANKW
jgi:hypothetical protein